MQQRMLGYPEVMTSLKFTRISTKPFGQRTETKIKLNEKGDLVRPDKTNKDKVSDERSSKSTSQLAREQKQLTQSRYMTRNQQLLYRSGGTQATTYDKVTQFGLRPVELLTLFRKLGQYFR